MELRIDSLLQHLRHDPQALLAQIDADPLLLKRESAGLVLANASKLLFSPQQPHQLFAKGIVYRRNPYRLVSLPLLKIFNLGEKAVTVDDLNALASLASPVAPRLHFLRKWDGTMIQRFEADGRIWFGTRGMLEGVALRPNDVESDDNEKSHFDYLGAAREIANAKYPALLQAGLDHLTLILELIHPEARVITDYRGREDLILLAVFDRSAHRYWPYGDVQQLANERGLTHVDAFAPEGGTLAEQIDRLLLSLTGSDQEGTVLTVEHGHEVVYRVKIKSPDYLRLLKLMVNCTYSDTVAMLDSFEQIPSWPEFEQFLKAKGNDQVPEEVLGVYREHYDLFQKYLTQCRQLQDWAMHRCAELRQAIGESADARLFRKLFADRAKSEPHKALLFTALDGRLDLRRVRDYVPKPQEVEEALARLK